MNKQRFLKLKPEYTKEYELGSIKINSLKILPKGVVVAEDISEFIGYNNRIEPNIVYFAKNIDCEYYIHITTEDTNIEELEQYIKLKLIFI